MQFMIRTYDVAHMPVKRMEMRNRHLEHISKISGSVVCAGGFPLVADR